jgi:hypothetical protein
MATRFVALKFVAQVALKMIDGESDVLVFVDAQVSQEGMRAEGGSTKFAFRPVRLRQESLCPAIGVLFCTALPMLAV